MTLKTLECQKNDFSNVLKKVEVFEKINASVQLQQPCEFDDALDLCREKSSRLWKMFLKKE